MATRYNQLSSISSEPGQTGATEIATNGNPVSGATADPPTTGQVITATSPTTFDWQTQSADGVSFNDSYSSLGETELQGAMDEVADRLPQGPQILAVGSTGLIYRSFESTSYSDLSSRLPGGDYADVIYSPEKNLYLIVGDSGLRLISNNGLKWTDSSTAGTNYTSAYYSKYHGKFFAIGGLTLHFSYDGVTWESVTSLPSETNINNMAENDAGLLVATATGTGEPLIYSEDGGVTWVGADSQTGSQTGFNAVVKTADGFMAVSERGVDGAARSADGKNWTAIELAADPPAGTSSWVTYIASLNRIVADSGLTTGPLTSDDNGDTWTLRSWDTLASTSHSGGYSTFHGRVVVTGGSNQEIEISDDGITWTAVGPGGSGSFVGCNAGSLGYLQQKSPVFSVFGRVGEITAETSDYNANQVDYDNSGSGLDATNTEAAIDELWGHVIVSPITEGTTTRTLQNSDHGKIILCDQSNTTVSVPDTIMDGFSCLLCNTAATGDLDVDVVSAATIVHPDSHSKARAQYSVIGLTYIGSGTYLLTGDTKA